MGPDIEGLVGWDEEINRKEVNPMEMKLEGNTLTLVIPLSQGTPSGSGKSLVVATTGGFVAVAGSNIKVSLNVIKPRS